MLTFDPALLKIRYNRDLLRFQLGFFLFVVLAVIHLPVVQVGLDAVGLFDLYTVGLFLLILFMNVSFKVDQTEYSTLSLYGVYLFYITLNMLLVLPEHTYLEFSIPLYVKQIQYLLIACVSLFFIKRVDKTLIRYATYLAVIIIFVYGVYQYATGEWYRLGIPLKLGTSSNPAGFILGILLLTLLYFITDKEEAKSIHKLFFWGVFLAGYGALLLTVSRTNNIAFFGVFVLFLFYRYRKRIILVVFIIGIIVLISYLVMNFALAGTSAAGKSVGLEFILNPELALQQHSFQARLTSMWVTPLEEWLSTPFTIMFGIGFGSVKAVDNLYLAMLYNAGVVGLLVYVAIFFHLFRNGDYRLKLAVLFILINGIAAETTLNSYRSMQVVIFFLMFMLHYYRKKPRLSSPMVPKKTT